MKSVIKNGKSLIVVLDNGNILSSNECTTELMNSVISAKNDEEIIELLTPKRKEVEEKIKKAEDFLDRAYKSQVITVKGSSFYMTNISELSLPIDLATAIVEAEEEKNKDLVQSYKNFWTLASLNPDSRARNNLFWFLKKYGMTITKSGLFVAYRNVKVKQEGTVVNSKSSQFISDSYVKVKKLKKSPKNYFVGKKDGDFAISTDKAKLTEVMEGSLFDLYEKLSDKTVKADNTTTIFTDNYTGKFDIQLGKPVTMPRGQCDSIQENTCSRGLHVASKEWLESNGSSFGNIPLMVLVNPTDVVAVPPADSYGKMRVASYFPLQIVNKVDGKIIETVEDGFEDDFMEMITYAGNINNKEEKTYKLEIPSIPELNRSLIDSRLREMRKNIKKNVN